MLLSVTNTSGAVLEVPFPISKTLAIGASKTLAGVSLRDLLFDPIKGDEAWRTLTGMKQAGKITFTLARNEDDTSLDPIEAILSSLMSSSFRSGTVTAAGAGDEAVVFSPAFPDANYKVALGSGTASLAEIKTAVAYAPTGFTITFAAAGDCDWIAIRL
jgi:hypothetical protein